MPGICGVVNVDADRPIDERVVRRMLHAMTWHGQDLWSGDGVALAGSVARSSDSSIHLALDGEIHDPKDTGGIIEAYKEFGDTVPTKLRGTFALALWDAGRRKLLLARDHAGARRLHYARCGGALVFASEVRAILKFPGVSRELDAASLDHFLTYEFVPGPATSFASIKTLLPAHVLRCREGKIDVKRYWRLDLREGETGDESASCARLLETLSDAIDIQLRGETTAPVLLSGGIDSSTVAALARETGRKVKTISIGFADRSYDERRHARLVARRLQTEHREWVIQSDVTRLAERLVGLLDQPFADSSMFPTFRAYEIAKEAFPAVLTGDGGDELFAGYDTLAAQRADRIYRLLPGAVRRSVIPAIADAVPLLPGKRGAVNTLKRFVEGAALDPRLAHLRWRTILSPAQKRQLYSDEFMDRLAASEEQFAFANVNPTPNEQLQHDFETYLPDYTLAKIDRIGAAHSLGIRMPFLDPCVIAAVASIPGRLKLKGSQRKYILKRAMAGRLPERILRRDKEGFSAPMRHWLRRELRPLLLDVLRRERTAVHGLFREEFIRRMTGEHLAGRRDHSHRLWALMVFQLWYEMNLCRG